MCPDVVVRADGSHEIGYGHLVRTGALADEYLSRNYSVTYVTVTPDQVREVCPDSVDVYALPDAEIEDDRGWVAELAPRIVVTDSHQLDETYHRSIRDNAPVVGAIVDDSRHPLCADVVINDNVYAPHLEYEWSGPEPVWCLGLECGLLRTRFRELSTETAPWNDPPAHALVMMGGSDLENRTPTVMEAFDGTDLDVTVIIGPGYQNEAEIRTTAAETNAEFSLRKTPEDLPEIMFRADFAVSTLGTTVNELFATQTPIIGIPDNQTPIADALSENDLAVVLDRSPSLEELTAAIDRMRSDTAFRRSRWEKAAELRSGNGPESVVDTFEARLDGP